MSTTLAELQNIILQKLGVANSKRVSKLFYRAPVAVVSEHVQYSPFIINTDDDLEVIFHCRRDFPEVRTTELYANLPPPAAPAGPVIPPLVASPSFAADLHRDDDDEYDLDDNRTFGELVTAVASNPRTPQMGIQISETEGVEEALREDEEEEEPELIADDSDEHDQNIPPPRRAPCSSGSHQYPEHFSSLDLESIAPTREENEADVLTPNEFEIRQIFQTKEDAVLSVKSYSIRRGVEYKVKESDHTKYHARCKNFGSGYEWLIRVALRTRKGF
ncbi:hypothetical protein PIB30_050868 [Stylosanthes scabra]|uniref:Transposase MuDR plant domain-containing protein n=1 Tax=Stylosanthes scabra TaxID=79078 RepID=A0ABU6SI69_9FABA|nr:hypothetical protein [Stylosanthes scabra]